jgi:hypothetical protein
VEYKEMISQWALVLILLSVSGLICFTILFFLSPGFSPKMMSKSVKGVHDPVRACASQAFNVIDGLDTWPLDPTLFDGVTVNEGDRVMLNIQNSAHENGIWQPSRVAGNQCSWKRASDLTVDEQIVVGNTVYVSEGDHYGGQTLVLQVMDTGMILSSRAKHEFRLALTFEPLIDLLLGTTDRTPGAVLVAKEHGGVKWRIPQVPVRPTWGTQQIYSDTWLVPVGEMNIHLLSWQDDWISATNETLWVIFLHLTQKEELLVFRNEVMVSKLSDKPRVCVLRSDTYKSSRPKSEEHSLNHGVSVELHDINASKNWWSELDHRSLMVTLENHTQTETQCMVRLVKV